MDHILSLYEAEYAAKEKEREEEERAWRESCEKLELMEMERLTLSKIGEETGRRLWSRMFGLPLRAAAMTPSPPAGSRVRPARANLQEPKQRDTVDHDGLALPKSYPIKVAYGYRATVAHVQLVFNSPSSTTSALQPQADFRPSRANGNPLPTKWRLDWLFASVRMHVEASALVAGAAPTLTESLKPSNGANDDVRGNENEALEDPFVRDDALDLDVMDEFFEVEMESYRVSPNPSSIQISTFPRSRSSLHRPRQRSSPRRGRDVLPVLASSPSTSDSSASASTTTPSETATVVEVPSSREFSSIARKTKKMLRLHGRSASPLPRPTSYLSAGTNLSTDSSDDNEDDTSALSQEEQDIADSSEPVDAASHYHQPAPPPQSRRQPLVKPPRASRKRFYTDTRFFLVYALENSVRTRLLSTPGAEGDALRSSGALGWGGSRAVTMVKRERMSSSGGGSGGGVGGGGEGSPLRARIELEED